MKTYYARSGSFANAIVISAFDSAKKRDDYVDDEPMSGEGSHYEHNRQAITAREAKHILAGNRRMKRDHQRNSAYDACYGTTEITEIN